MLQKLKKLNCVYCAVLLLLEKIVDIMLFNSIFGIMLFNSIDFRGWGEVGGGGAVPSPV